MAQYSVLDERQLRCLHRRPAHAHIRVAPWAKATAAAQIFITHIDPPGESLAPLDDHEFAMITKVELKAIAPSPRRLEPLDAHSAFTQDPHPPLRQAVAAHLIVEKTDLHTRPSPLHQPILKSFAHHVVPHDVKLHKQVFTRRIDSREEGVESRVPVHQQFDVVAAREIQAGIAPLDLPNICFMGTGVESGVATAVILTTGAQTYFGSMAGSMAGEPVQTSFDKGVRGFSWLMITFMSVMVPMVFVINGVTKHNWQEAFLFSIAVAVGPTPEMLPRIVSDCLSKGALAMSRKKVIVKKLDSIQNLGAMDVLCTDKTGTLTMDKVILEKHCDVMRKENAAVLLDAFLIAHFQTGLKNVLDRAVLNYRDTQEKLAAGCVKVDEIPFDFVRRMMSVLVQKPAKDHVLLTKGAPEAVFRCCKFYELDGEVSPLEPTRAAQLIKHYEALSADGYRVLAVAHKHLATRSQISKADESDLVLKGYIAFLDPPKDSAARAIDALQKHGITVKVLTGDNDLVTRTVCRQGGLIAEEILLGAKVETMNDEDLASAAERINVFARLLPAHKQRIIEALRSKGHVVGYIGDGINDAPALHVADVGISVDSGVDIAKATAGIILLEKDLMILDEGWKAEKVFVNILKYIRMGASSNFGNMFSVLGASAFLPFMPMTPIQILMNKLLYDFSQVAIPTDNVGPDEIAKPRKWEIGNIGKFVLFIGPLSSFFDYTTFFVMLYLFHCWDPVRTPLFQTAWFVESLMTQTLIVHVIRTKKIPFIQSQASWQLTLSTFGIMAVSAWLPFSPLASALGFTTLPWLYWLILLATLVSYVFLTQVVKMWLFRKSYL